MQQTCKYRTISAREIKSLNEHIDILLVTVTAIESKALHDLLKPLPGTATILKSSKEILTYSIGVLGNYQVCHVESKMGSVGIGSSLMTVGKAIEDWNPKVIIMVGIAFGINSKTQKIGDVLVSEHVMQYQNEKVTKMGKKENRGDKHRCSPTLLDRFKSYHTDWNYPITKHAISSVLTGDILSGEVLIDNIDHRDDLLERFPTAIGGEMEGVGLANAAIVKAKDWIVVKSICDFADGNKRKNKERRQKLAAGAAASLCEFILNHNYVFEDFGIDALLATPELEDTQPIEIKENLSLDKIKTPEIPGLTDNGMESDMKLTRAFFGQSVSSRFRIGTRLRLVDEEEIKSGDNVEISTQILIRAKQKGLLGQIWSILLKNDPNPFN